MSNNSNGGKQAPKLKRGDCVGKRVGVFWEGDKEFFYGVVREYDPERPNKKEYLVLYDDNEEYWERLGSLDFQAAIDMANGKKPEKPLNRKRPRTPPLKSPDKGVGSNLKLSLEGKSSSNQDNSEHKKKKSKLENKESSSSTSSTDASSQSNDSRSNNQAKESFGGSSFGKKLQKKEKSSSSNSISTSGKDNAGGTELKKKKKKHNNNDERIGRRCRVWWSGDKQYFYGKVIRVHSSKPKLLVKYDDNEKEWEKIDDVKWCTTSTKGSSSSGKSGEKKESGEQKSSSSSSSSTGVIKNANGKKELEKEEQDESKKSKEGGSKMERSHSGEPPTKKKATAENHVSSSFSKEKEKETKDKGKSESKPQSQSQSLENKKLQKKKSSSMSTASTTVKNKEAVRDDTAATNTATTTKTKKSTTTTTTTTTTGKNDDNEKGKGKEKEKDSETTPPKPSITQKPSSGEPPRATTNIKSGHEALGWRVEVYYRPGVIIRKGKFGQEEEKGEEQKYLQGEIVNIKMNTEAGNENENKSKPSYVVGITGGKGHMILDVITIDDDQIGYFTKFSEKSKVPILLDRVKRSDVQSISRLLHGGASTKPLIEFGDKEDVDDNVFEFVLQRTPPAVKTEMIKLLLDHAGVGCSTRTCITLMQRCIESFKDHVLMKKLIMRARKLKFTEEQQEALYRYCVDHILRLNAETKLDKIDQMTVSLLNDSLLGYSFHRSMKNVTHGSKARTAQDGRSNSILEGTPLIHAMARGNIPMAVRLMEMEIKHTRDAAAAAGKPIPSTERIKISEKHWVFKLSDSFKSYQDEWHLEAPVRLVLFFFIVTKSFSGSKALLKILNSMKKLAIIDLKTAQPPEGQAPLLFLCSLTEKKLQIRIREAILQLLSAGANPNIMDADGLTPLLACVKFRTPKFINLLVSTGKADCQLGSPLIKAFELGHQEEAEALINCGAQLNREIFQKGDGLVAQYFVDRLDLLKILVSRMDNAKEKQTILAFLLTDSCQVKSPNVKVIDFLLASGANPVMINDQGNNALIVCIARANANILKRILSKRRSININALEHPGTGQPLLVWACQFGEQAVVKVLLESVESDQQPVVNNNSPATALGGGANTTSGKGKLGSKVKGSKGQARKGSVVRQTPAAAAASLSKSDASQLANIALPPASSDKDKKKRDRLRRHPSGISKQKLVKRLGLRIIASSNVLIAACESGNADLVRTLLSSGADTIDVNVVTSQGWTPLHLASSLGDAKMVSVLLEHGANLKLMDDNQQTALDWASIAGHFDVVHTLILKDPNQVSHRDSNGLSALELAIRYGHAEVASLLVQKGARLNGIEL